MDESRNYWAQLVCSSDVDAPILHINLDSFTIGRSKGCDLSIPDNHLVSSRHCHIFKDADDEVWLQDNSTNGTLINIETRISKGQKYRLKHGDEIHVVYKKNNPESNVAYLYQDAAELEKELDSTDSDLQRTDCTLEYDISACNDASPAMAPKEQQESPAVKRIKLDDSALGQQGSEQEPTQTRQQVGVNTAAEGPSGAQAAAGITSGEGSSSKHMMKNFEAAVCRSSAVGEVTSGERSSAEKAEVAPGAVQATSAVAAGMQASSKGNEAGPSRVNERDDMEETLLCSICQDILHNAVSLQPCMHTFCAACYSSWMSKSKECPSCRNNVDRIGFNHIVKNLVEVYLKEHPDKRRSDEDIKEMDTKNKITNDMVYPRRRNNESIDYLGSSDSYSGSDSDTSPSFNIGFTPMSLFTSSTCRQCENYVPPSNCGRQQTATTVPSSLCTATGATAVGARGRRRTSGQVVPIPSSISTLDADVQRSKMTPCGRVVPMPNPPQYSCAANANHLVCMCCREQMPDRRSDGIVPDLPPQSCSSCQRFFCHMYWGCSKPTCLGCLNQLKDLKFSQDCTRSLVSNNPHESQILMNYIQSKNLTYLDLFQECLVQMDSNRYKPPSQAHRQTTSTSVFCYMCGLTVFKELAYLYRKDIQNNELPNDVASRPNCYWGKQCRTQVNKPHHASCLGTIWQRQLSSTFTR